VGGRCSGAIGMTDKKLRGSLSREATARQLDVLAAFVECGGSISRAAASLGIRPSTVKRHLADLRARLGLTTEQPIYADGLLDGSLSRVSSPCETDPSGPSTS